tara:strand:- start:390 stop:626 length:237 start_codon:yes stop_codon:yes gene_type:complete
MLNWIKNLFTSSPATVAEAPYKLETPVVAPVVAPVVEKPKATPKTADIKKAAPKSASKKPAAIKSAPAKRGRKPKTGS